MHKSCFLCGEEIKDKTSREHIFGDSFLGFMKLKQKVFRYHLASEELEYSRLKVPAHVSCNNEFGSRFEEYILQILNSFSSNRDVLEQLHTNSNDDIVLSIREVLSQWMAKIHMGIIYWESNYKKHKKREYQEYLRELLDDPVLKKLQQCFHREYKFNVPSSLFYFNIPKSNKNNIEFDFGTGLPHGLTYIKFNEHLLISCTADDYLVTEWFTQKQYKSTRNQIMQLATEYPTAYLFAVGHIWAVRENLPCKPILEFTDSAVISHSRTNMKIKPIIDADLVEERAQEIMLDHEEKFIAKSA